MSGEEGYDGPGRPVAARTGGPDPEAVARELVDRHDFLADETGRLFFYASGAWSPIEKNHLHRLIRAHAGRPGGKRSFREEVGDNVRILAFDPEEPRIRFGRVAAGEIACRAGVLDVLTGKTRPHRPEDRLERVLPHDYEPEAALDAWDAALVDWFGREDGTLDERAAAVQEFAGYTILAHARYKKALLFYGPGDTGKSEIVWVLQQLVGVDACCALSVDAMDDPVKLCVLQGKLLNVMSELSARSLVKDSGFKTLVSTEEPVMLNPKYAAPLMYHPLAKHVVATNELPRLTSRTAEVFNRFLIVPMDRPIPRSRQDPDLRSKLAVEMPAIFAWAVEGARRLIAQRGQFTDPPGREAVLAQWREESNPVIDWLAGHLHPCAGNNLPLSWLARRIGHDLRRTVTANEVGKAARERDMQVDLARPREADGTAGRPCQCVRGWEVRSPEEFRDPVSAGKRM